MFNTPMIKTKNGMSYGKHLPTPLRQLRTAARVYKVIMRVLPFVLLLGAALKLASALKTVRFSAKDLSIDRNTRLKHVIAMGNITLINSPVNKAVAGNMVSSDGPIKTAIAGNCVMSKGEITKSISHKK